MTIHLFLTLDVNMCSSMLEEDEKKKIEGRTRNFCINTHTKIHTFIMFMVVAIKKNFMVFLEPNVKSCFIGYDEG
jgi:hypothetical protein